MNTILRLRASIRATWAALIGHLSGDRKEHFPPRSVGNDLEGYARAEMIRAGCQIHTVGQPVTIAAADELYDRTALFVAKDRMEIMQYVDFMTGSGMRVTFISDLDDAVNQVFDNPTAWDFVIVRLDDFPQKNATTFRLWRLRQRAPYLRVVLLAKDATEDQFPTGTRQPLYDAVLRTPTLLADFEVGLVTALV